MNVDKESEAAGRARVGLSSLLQKLSTYLKIERVAHWLTHKHYFALSDVRNTSKLYLNENFWFQTSRIVAKSELFSIVFKCTWTIVRALDVCLIFVLTTRSELAQTNSAGEWHCRPTGGCRFEVPMGTRSYKGFADGRNSQTREAKIFPVKIRGWIILQSETGLLYY